MLVHLMLIPDVKVYVLENKTDVTDKNIEESCYAYLYLTMMEEKNDCEVICDYLIRLQKADEYFKDSRLPDTFSFKGSVVVRSAA